MNYSDIMPLSEFPLHKRCEIAWAVAQPDPPPKWLRLGFAEIVSRAWIEWYIQRGLTPGRRRSGKFKTGVREAVIARDGFVCGLCGGDVEYGDIHIDHIIPVSRGGTDDLDNLQVAHALCNMRKGARMDDD